MCAFVRQGLACYWTRKTWRSGLGCYRCFNVHPMAMAWINTIQYQKIQFYRDEHLPICPFAHSQISSVPGSQWPTLTMPQAMKIIGLPLPHLGGADFQLRHSAATCRSRLLRIFEWNAIDLNLNKKTHISRFHLFTPSLFNQDRIAMMWIYDQDREANTPNITRPWINLFWLPCRQLRLTVAYPSKSTVVIQSKVWLAYLCPNLGAPKPRNQAWAAWWIFWVCGTAKLYSLRDRHTA